jgi:hypothetical protein
MCIFLRFSLCKARLSYGNSAGKVLKVTHFSYPSLWIAGKRIKSIITDFCRITRKKIFCVKIGKETPRAGNNNIKNQNLKCKNDEIAESLRSSQ